ncbi:MAG TPA: LUD domain-containing protein [Acidimicrobiia bacterium]|jgi:L-lactate dehydrogenase complex protein LldG|nr:LUD domain-containing protein [Acidimicrobiia bacterium]
MTADLVERFAEMLTAVGGTAHGPLPVDEALDLLVELCRERAGGAAVALSTGDPVVQQLGVEERLGAEGLEVLRPDDVFWRERLAEAGVGVTGAVTAAAAIGTVGIACGPRAPRATSLVPPAHICLVLRATMVDDLAEALRRCTPTATDNDLPSGLVWVSGPSRSADLELVLTVGVHGPGSVDVIVIDENFR